MEQSAFNFDPRRAARSGDPVTSVMAAESVAPHVTKDCRAVLAVFFRRRFSDPLDDFELAEAMGRKQTSVGKRRGELERAGLVERKGRRRSPSSLTNSVVYSFSITAEGVKFYLDEWAKNQKEAAR